MSKGNVNEEINNMMDGILKRSLMDISVIALMMPLVMAL
jgi:hypothetical protein